MHVVIDCFKLVKGAGKSIGIYNVALSMIQNLVLEKEKSSNSKIVDTRITVLGNSINRSDFDVKGVDFFEVKTFDPLNKIHALIWETIYVTTVCKRLKADRVVFPRGFSALTHSVFDIVLIHDLIPFYYDEHYPGFFNKVENKYIMSRLRQSARGAKKVITISEASKNDIIKYCGVHESKITVIHNACNAIGFSEAKEDMNDPYICAMTSGLPHKNAKGIFESYKRYCEVERKPLKLVVLGVADTSMVDMPEGIRSLITCFKYVDSNDKLYKLINNSTVFMFLSLVEGFGLPPIEAMMLKVPVICSNTSSLPEVVGDAAVLVNPNDYKEVATKLDMLINNREWQQNLVERGLANVSRFSWDSRAKLYWDAILN